jgi:hypothetical protein
MTLGTQLAVILETEPEPVLADLRPEELRHLVRLLREWTAASVEEYSRRTQKMEAR